MKKSEALKILGLSEGCSDDDIKKAHRQKIRENHPDKFSDPQKKIDAEEQTKLINEARDVLANRRWDPEYGPRTSAGYNPYGPYGNPFGGPSAQYRPGAGGSNPYGENPFGQGFPFDFVWTSWDATGSGYAGQGDDPFDPFSSVFTREPEKTAQEELEDATSALRRTAAFIGVKLLVLALCSATGAISVGIAIYTIATIAFALFYQSRGCSKALVVGLMVFLLPLALRLVPLVLVASLSPLSIVLCVVAVVYDFSVARSLLSAYRTTREKAKVAKA